MPYETASRRERPGNSRAAHVVVWLLVAASVGAGVCAQADRMLGSGSTAATGAGSVATQSGSLGSPGSSGSSTTAPVRDNASAGDTLRTAQLAELLDRRAEALLRGDETLWLAGVEPRARRAFEARFDRLVRLPWISARYRVLGPGPAATTEQRAQWGAKVWSANVEFSFRLPGDTRDVKRKRVVTLRPDGDDWDIVSDVPGDGPRDVWDVTDVRVARGERSLVIASRGQDVHDYLDEADAAARAVDAFWGTYWTRTLTVIVPRDGRAMAAVLGRDTVEGAEQIAAVTTGELDRSGTPGAGDNPTTADRIVVNPKAFGAFNAAERQIVLTHEATHVAVRASSRADTPVWLEEGFADYVAYVGSGLSRDSIASDLLSKIRSGWQLRHLPSEDEFDPAQGDVGPAYAAAWLALDRIAADHGRDAVVRFTRIANGLEPEGRPDGRSEGRREPAGETPLARAFALVTGQDQAAFEARWIEAVTQAARGS